MTQDERLDVDRVVQQGQEGDARLDGRHLDHGGCRAARNIGDRYVLRRDGRDQGEFDGERPRDRYLAARCLGRGGLDLPLIGVGVEAQKERARSGHRQDDDDDYTRDQNAWP
jgi:hypothetical protein